MDFETTITKKEFKIIVTICVLAGLFWIIDGCNWDRNKVIRQAKARVSSIFRGIKKDEKGSEYVENPEQIAICQW